MFRVRHDVYIHFDDPSQSGVQEKLDQILTILALQGEQLMEQSEAIAALKDRLQADWGHAQDVIAQQAQTIADLGGQLTAALANDAADAETIAAKQAEVDALVADADQAVAEINAIDLDASFPAPEEPAPGETPVEEPPVG